MQALRLTVVLESKRGRVPATTVMDGSIHSQCREVGAETLRRDAKSFVSTLPRVDDRCSGPTVSWSTSRSALRPLSRDGPGVFPVASRSAERISVIACRRRTWIFSKTWRTRFSTRFSRCQRWASVPHQTKTTESPRKRISGGFQRI